MLIKSWKARFLSYY